jgi:RNA polymerase sigma factor FliA
VLQLSGREQTILALRYHQELNFAEIGEIFQVTESRISQIHAKALLQLRVLMAERTSVAYADAVGRCGAPA